MERLTYDFCIGEKHCWQIKGADNFTCKEVCENQDGCEKCPIAEAFDRLAAYEDTMPLERAQELAQAEKDGQLMVLPVKIGEILYAGEDSPALPVAVTDIGLLLDGPGGEDWERLGNIGKTVFLTREEAEAALKKREGNNEAD